MSLKRQWLCNKEALEECGMIRLAASRLNLLHIKRDDENGERDNRSHTAEYGRAIDA